MSNLLASPRTLKTMFLWVLMIFPAIFAEAAVPGLFEGRVQDEKGTALVGATVQLFEDGAQATPYATITDSNGAFRFSNVRAGQYTVWVSFLGYGSRSIPINLEEGDRRDFLVVMSEQALSHDEVIVQAGRARPKLSPVTYSNITALELAQEPDMKDLPVYLSRQPSTTYYSENGNAVGYSTLRMRGFDQRRLAVAINGIPQNDPEEFNVFWVNFFDIQGAVQDIQIQRGAGSSVYGPTAIGGAIDIRAFPYKPAAYGSVHVGTGTFGTSRASAEVNSGLLGGKYVVYGRLSRMVSDGYRDWSWTEFWRFFVGVTRFGDRSTLTIQAFGGPQKDGLAYSGIPKGANSATLDDGYGGEIDRKYNFSSFTRDTEEFHQPHVELHHSYEVNSTLKFQQTAFAIKGEGFFDFGGTFRSANYLRLPVGLVDTPARAEPLYLSLPEAQIQFRAYLDQWQVGWMPKLTRNTATSSTSIGLEARLHRSLRWGRIQEGSGIPSELVGSENDVRVYSFRGEKKIYAAYASHLHRISEDWALQADVQLTNRTYRVYDEAFFGRAFSKSYSFINPRVGVTFRPEKALSAYTSVALAHREPRMKSLYDGEEAGEGFLPRFETDINGAIDTDRPLVRPERLIDVELGLSWTGERFSLNTNFFAMMFKDELVPSGGLDQYGVPRTGNADRSRHLGWELDGSIRVSKALQIAGNVTVSKNSYVDFIEFVTLPDYSTGLADRSGNTIAGFPSQNGNLSVLWTKNEFFSSIQTAFVGKQYIDNSEARDLGESRTNTDLTVDPFVLVDASFGYTFKRTSAFKGLVLRLDVNNVLNDRILTFGQVSFGSGEFFPAATRHVFLSAKYTFD